MLEKILSGQQELSQERRDMTTGGVMAIPFLHAQMIRFFNMSMAIQIREKSMHFNLIAAAINFFQYMNGLIRNHGVIDTELDKPKNGNNQLLDGIEGIILFLTELALMHGLTD